MPYFLYRLSPGCRPVLVATHDKFQDAKSQVRQLRAGQAQGEPQQFRMIFAEDSHKALVLITDTRSTRTDGDD